MTKKDLQLKKISDKPGVYLFLGSTKRGGGGKKGRDILYIGKATSLRDRVRSYFRDDLIEIRGPLITDMVFKSKKVDFIETDSVLEALILEANLIKKHQPLYNTKEKSDKSFCFVIITKEEFPRIFTMRGKELEDLKSRKLSTLNFKLSTVFGPFTSTKILIEALRIIRKIFPFLEKKRGIKGKEEFYRQLGMVPEVGDGEAPSFAKAMKGAAKEYMGHSSHIFTSLEQRVQPVVDHLLLAREYKKTIRNIKFLFEGKKKTLIKKLEKEMKELAKKEEFEKATRLRKQIFALQYIQDVALIKEENKLLTTHYSLPTRIEAYDVAHISGKSMVGVMTVVEGGEVAKSEYRKFKIRGYESSNDPGALKEILDRRFGHPEWHAPSLIVVDGGKAQKNAAEYVLRKIDLPIPVVAVIKDDKHRAKNIIGDKKLIRKHETDILLSNAEAHRFAIGFHRETARKCLKFS